MHSQTCVPFEYGPRLQQAVFALVSPDFVTVAGSTHRRRTKRYDPCIQQIINVRRKPLHLSVKVVAGFALIWLLSYREHRGLLPQESKPAIADETKSQMC